MLRQKEVELFQSLTSGEFSNFALVEGLFMGKRAAFMACINRNGEEYLITPLGILLQEADLEHCLGPEGESLSKGE